MKQLIYLAIGAAVGFASGYFVGKKLEERRSEKELNDLSAYYDASKRYIRYNSEETDQNAEEKEDRPKPESRKEAVRKIRESKAEKVINYTAYYGDDSNSDDSYEDTPEMAANRFHDENKNRPPELISMDEYNSGSFPPHFDSQILFYYAFDETVTDEDECMIDEPGHLIGRVMEESGFIEDDTMQIYVVNYQTDCIYEVNKILASYCETHEIVMSEDAY